MVGPSGAGKTTLFNALLDQSNGTIADQFTLESESDDDGQAASADKGSEEGKFRFSQYQETTSVKIGLKFFDTVDDKWLFPLSLKVIDTPGTIKKNVAQVTYSFQKPTIVLIVMDFSKKLYRSDIVEWTKFTLEKI